jgi:hypothetical protein
MATPTNLPASFNVGAVLTAAQMNDVRGAFRILQVVSGTTASLATTTSATYADTNLTVTITPQSASSKIFVVVNQSNYNDVSSTSASFRLVRGSTTLQQQNDAVFSNVGGIVGNVSFMYLDSPATTSATTYKTTFSRLAGGGTVYAQVNSNPANITVFEVSA